MQGSISKKIIIASFCLGLLMLSGVSAIYSDQLAVFVGGVNLVVLMGVYWLLTQQHYQANLEQVAERERLIAASIQRIRQTLDLEVILETTVREVRQFLQVDRVLVYRIWPDGTGSTIAEAVVPGHPQILGQPFPAEVFPPEIHQLYCQGRIRAIVDPEKDDVAPCLIEFLRELGVKSKLVVAILNQSQLWGLLIAHHCCQPRQWQPLEIDLLNQLATQVTIAIQQAELYRQLQTELIERKRAQEALRQAHDRLEMRVMERTVELSQINASLQTEIGVRLQVEEALRQSQARNQALLNAIPDLMFRLNHQGIFIDFLGKSNELLMMSESIIGATIYQSQLPLELIETIMEAINNALDTRRLQTLEYALPMPNGILHYEARIVASAKDEVVAIVRNITERKETEEVRQALEREQELRKLQLNFFSMASHEFRTPLSTILASAQILKYYTHESSEEKRHRSINRIETTAKNMTQLLNDILTINRAEIGKLDINISSINLNHFCSDLIEEMHLNAGSKYKITFTSQCDYPTVCLDEKLLRSVLINLLSNAIKYSPDGGEIHLGLTCTEHTAIFQIQDHGIGIPLDDQKHLFEVFHRGTNIANIPGVGLGLTVVKKCLDLQGGKISVKSEVGVGTTFTVTIPVSC